MQAAARWGFILKVLVSHHVVTRQQPLEELGLFVLDGFDDELVIAGQVEEGPAGPRVGQLDQGLVHQGVLRNEEHRQQETDFYTNNRKKKNQKQHWNRCFGWLSEQRCSGFMGRPLNFYMLQQHRRAVRTAAL